MCKAHATHNDARRQYNREFSCNIRTAAQFPRQALTQSNLQLTKNEETPFSYNLHPFGSQWASPNGRCIRPPDLLHSKSIIDGRRSFLCISLSSLPLCKSSRSPCHCFHLSNSPHSPLLTIDLVELQSHCSDFVLAIPCIDTTDVRVFHSSN